jgi:aflatoxin B1 aldehyde reductase
MSSQSPPHILLGSGSGFIPNSDPKAVAALLKHIKTLPVPFYAIDTAAIYPSPNPGISEKVLGEAGIGDHAADLVLDTKILVGPTVDGSHGGALSTVNMQRSIDKSLASLKVSKVRCVYAHMPDTATPAAEAVAGFGKILADGKAEIWGVSNFSVQQLKEYIAEAEKQGVAKPKLFQGMYNAICRYPEEDLFPVLKEHGMIYYAYS